MVLDNYVIDPDGYLYKCWDDAGDKTKAVYSLKDKKFRNLKQETAYIISTQAAFLKECSDCILLYTCQGGCPHKRLEKKNECLVLKNNMDEFLERYYEISQHKDFVL
jgi:uncharacterized protein